MAVAECLVEVSSFPFEAPFVFDVLPLPNGRFATAHGYPANDVRVWSGSGVLEATLEGHDNVVYAVAHCPATGDIVSASWDGTVKVWRDGACFLTLAGHAGAVVALDASPVDGNIVSGSTDGTAKVWAPSTGECLATLESPLPAPQDAPAVPVVHVCVLSTGDVAVASASVVHVWERGSWSCTAAHKQPGAVSALARLPCGSFAVSTGDLATPGTVSVWQDGREKWSLATLGRVDEFVVGRGIFVGLMAAVAFVVQDGVVAGDWLVSRASVAALPDGKFAVVADEGADKMCRVYRVVRPSRIVTIHVMIAAWSAHVGTPPPESEPTAAAVLARTLSLRRFCRPRDEPGVEEVVEPFAKDIVSFM